MADMQTATAAQGKIVQCIGAVVDVEFPRDKLPKVYDALKMEGTALTLEVQQQLGDGVVRTIALGSSDGLLTRYIEAQIYQAMVENQACEQAARMVAMKNASDNAGDIISNLQLVYNKARQASITKELAEIVGGAAAV